MILPHIYSLVLSFSAQDRLKLGDITWHWEEQGSLTSHFIPV
jgi:hypothetical protein